MTNKIQLRKLLWEDIVVYFVNLSDKEDFSAKDLVDYFHFKYLNSISISRWTSPNYICEKSCANKLFSLYDKDFCLKLIDVLFEKHEKLIGRPFNNIRWSLSLLSSEKNGWLLTKLFEDIALEGSVLDNDFVKRLNNKARSQWTFEENQKYNEIINKGVKNGKKA